MSKSPKRPILILLADQFADWETPLISGAGRSFYDLDVRLASPDGGKITSMGGMTVAGLEPFAPTGGDVVAICGGNGWETESGLVGRMAPLLEKARAEGAVLAAICGGVRLLAKGGFLAGKRHTSNGRDWINHWAPGYAGADLHVDQPQALRDGDIITAAGIAPASFAAQVMGAAGLSQDKLAEFRAMIGAEHGAPHGGTHGGERGAGQTA